MLKQKEYGDRRREQEEKEELIGSLLLPLFSNRVVVGRRLVGKWQTAVGKDHVLALLASKSI